MAQTLQQLKAMGLPEPFAEELYASAASILQERQASAAEPVDESLRARVSGLEAKVAEMLDELQKQRGAVPDVASQRLDEEQRRALSSLLTEDVLQVPLEALPPPTPDSQLQLSATRCEALEKRVAATAAAAQASALRAGELRAQMGVVQSGCGSDHSIEQAITDKENSRGDVVQMRGFLRQQAAPGQPGAL